MIFLVKSSPRIVVLGSSWNNSELGFGISVPKALGRVREGREKVVSGHTVGLLRP